MVGRRLVGAGADLVVGGHPHWVQGARSGTADAVLAHSLGNLVFDMDFMEQTMEGVTLTATFWGDRLMRVALTPYRMDARFAPRLADGPVGRRHPRRRLGQLHGPVPSPLTQRSQASSTRPVRRSWAGSTTAGTSAGEW